MYKQVFLEETTIENKDPSSRLEKMLFQNEYFIETNKNSYLRKPNKSI